MAMLMLILVSCSNTEPIQNNPGKLTTTNVPATEIHVKKPVNLIDINGNSVQDRIKVPDGYVRIEAKENSFAHFLRNLTLKAHGSKIKLYNGETRSTDHHTAILDIDVGDRDLQQCADAVMRLRAEYLYRQQAYEKIHFNFTNGFVADYATWMNGGRIKVEGNKAYWIKSASPSSDYDGFRKYLNMVFSYAGTLSLSKEMTSIPIEEMSIGDVFIKGASPGHTVIILDMAQNEETGEKIFMIAQSYMPAQDIHILKNLENEELSPWYSVDFGDALGTPEWDFHKSQLMRFED